MKDFLQFSAIPLALGETSNSTTPDVNGLDIAPFKLLKSFGDNSRVTVGASCVTMYASTCVSGCIIISITPSPTSVICVLMISRVALFDDSSSWSRDIFFGSFLSETWMTVSVTNDFGWSSSVPECGFRWGLIRGARSRGVCGWGSGMVSGGDDADRTGLHTGLE